MAIQVTIVARGNRIRQPRVFYVELDSEAGFFTWLDEIEADAGKAYLDRRYGSVEAPVELKKPE